MRKQKCSRGHGSRPDGQSPKRNVVDCTELAAILQDLIRGILPLRELPGFIAWLITTPGGGR